MLNYSDVSASLSHVFLGYQIRVAQGLMDGKLKDDVKKEIGKPPCSGNVETARVHVTSRYTLENYQLDPFVVFGILIEEQRAPPLPGVSVSAGDEHLMRELPASILQTIVEHVAAQVEPRLGNIAASEKAATAVTFTSGVSVHYPNWMLTRPGHGLLSIYQSVFGQHLVTPPRLERSFRRLRLVPIELAKIMAQLQQA